MGYVGRLEDWFDGPSQIFKDDYVTLTAAQIKRIKEIKIEYPDPIVALGKRLQIENGVLSGDEYHLPEEFHHEKLDRIEKYAAEFPKLIIWVKLITIIVNSLKKDILYTFLPELLKIVRLSLRILKRLRALSSSLSHKSARDGSSRNIQS
jgi:hypothetical protein